MHCVVFFFGFLVVYVMSWDVLGCDRLGWDEVFRMDVFYRDGWMDG